MKQNKGKENKGHSRHNNTKHNNTIIEKKKKKKHKYYSTNFDNGRNKRSGPRNPGL